MVFLVSFSLSLGHTSSSSTEGEEGTGTTDWQWGESVFGGFAVVCISKSKMTIPVEKQRVYFYLKITMASAGPR